MQEHRGTRNRPPPPDQRSMSWKDRAALIHCDREPWPRCREWPGHTSSSPQPPLRCPQEIVAWVHGPKSACLQGPGPLHRSAHPSWSRQHLNPNRTPSHHLPTVQLRIESIKQFLERMLLDPWPGRDAASPRPRSRPRHLRLTCFLGHAHDFPPGTGLDARRAVIVT